MAIYYQVTFNHSPGSLGTLIEYRKSTESLWTKPTTAPNPTSLTEYILELQEGFDYVVRLSSYGGKCIPTYRIKTLQTGSSFVWIEDESYCEESDPFNSIASYTGFADPMNIGYDSVSGKMFVVDVSSTSKGSNLYSFDPNSFTGISSATAMGGIDKFVLASVMDMDNRQIFMTGANTSGMIRYDISTNAVSTLLYGTNGLHSKNTISKFGNQIVSPDYLSATLFIINTTTFTVQNSIPYSSIPSYTQYFSNGNIILKVNNEWWVLASAGANLGPNGSGIARYNSNFTILLGVINLPGQVTWTNGAYWRSVLLESNRLFILDFGSSKLMVVNLLTMSVLTVYTFTNRKGKVASAMSLTKDPVSGDYLIAGSYSNNANTDTAVIYIAYKLDPVSFQPTHIYPNLAVSKLERQGTTTKLFSVNPGIISYPTPNGTSSTDGTISIFDKSGGDDFTGIRIVTTLKQIDASTSSPTGLKKANIVGATDYIPPYLDPTGCEKEYDLVCPTANATQTGTSIEYEYSLKSATADNPVLDHIVLQQVDLITSSILVSTTVPKNTYQKGTLIKSGSNSNRVDLLFKNSSGTTIGTCTNLFTIT